MKGIQGRPIQRMLSGTVIAVGLLFLSACTHPAPERSFTTMELLIEPSDVPEGWQWNFGPTETEDHIGSGAWITFLTTESHTARADHHAYRYPSVSRARTVYGKFFSDPVGETPLEWTYQSPVADQSSFACYNNRGEEHCEWAGRYEEYIVTFGIWLIPDQVSLEDVEQVVRVIDARMARYLDKSFEDSSG